MSETQAEGVRSPYLDAAFGSHNWLQSVRVETSDGESRTELRLPDSRFEIVVKTASSDPSRALRIEAVTPLWITSHIGTDSQRKIAGDVLAKLADDPDELVAAAAGLLLESPFDSDELEAYWGG